MYYLDSTSTNRLDSVYNSGDGFTTPYIFRTTIPSSNFDDGWMKPYIQINQNTPRLISGNNIFVDHSPPTNFNFTISNINSFRESVQGELIKLKFIHFEENYLSSIYNNGDVLSTNEYSFPVRFYTSNEDGATNSEVNTFINENLDIITLSNLDVSQKYYIKADVSDLIGNKQTFNISGLTDIFLYTYLYVTMQI